MYGFGYILGIFSQAHLVTLSPRIRREALFCVAGRDRLRRLMKTGKSQIFSIGLSQAGLPDFS
jgi:hypothetical protein